MIAYLIKGITRKGLQIFTYTNIAAANRAAETRFTDYATTVASEESDLSGRSGPALVQLYNLLIDDGAPPVNKFTTRADGARRIMAILTAKYQHQPVESEADNVVPDETESATTSNEDDMAAKGKTKKAKKEPKPKKAPRIKKERVVKPRKDRAYKTEVVSKGSKAAKGTALEMIQRANGATAEEIKDRLGVSLGTAKNLVWYLRRDGNKIVVNKKAERKPYIIE